MKPSLTVAGVIIALLFLVLLGADADEDERSPRILRSKRSSAMTTIESRMTKETIKTWKRWLVIALLSRPLKF